MISLKCREHHKFIWTNALLVSSKKIEVHFKDFWGLQTTSWMQILAPTHRFHCPLVLASMGVPGMEVLQMLRLDCTHHNIQEILNIPRLKTTKITNYVNSTVDHSLTILLKHMQLIHEIARFGMSLQKMVSISMEPLKVALTTRHGCPDAAFLSPCHCLLHTVSVENGVVHEHCCL